MNEPGSYTAPDFKPSYNDILKGFLQASAIITDLFDNNRIIREFFPTNYHYRCIRLLEDQITIWQHQLQTQEKPDANDAP